ncbi:MAG: endonuclease/exonuclease/phosphatase family protein [Actinomycetota bacterium]|nr:endonuclease/exonuclease/phosphatase family protein [Actinomycetota bacterium]
MKRERFRLATFNVHHCRGRDGRVDVDRTARVMQFLGADLIGLQELDRHLSRSDHTDQPALLSERTGYRVAFHATVAFEEGEYGIALASREGLDTAVEPLPRIDEDEPRVVVNAQWRELSVLTTHLSRDAVARAPQIEALAALAGRVGAPVAVLGDLNERRRGLRPLRQAGLRPESREMPSIKNFKEAVTGAIDHVLVGREMTILRTRRIATNASDHRPLVIDVEIQRSR